MNKNHLNPRPLLLKEFTMVKLNVTERSKVKLELFNLQGNLVATLIDQELSPDSFEIKLNTSLLKPGIYSCRMTCGRRVETIKIDVIE